MSICILGGGKQGSVIASYLSRKHEVIIYDRQQLFINNCTCKVADLSNPSTIGKIANNHKLIIGALPANIAFKVADTIARSKCKYYVDIAFYREDIYGLSNLVLKNRKTFIPDCGFAPGISNLIAGQQVKNEPEELHIKVGGFSKDPTAPYGYVVSWSLEDLLDEYIRPARIIDNYKVIEVSALSGLKTFKIDSIGELEEFYTDGLRTLLRFSNKIKIMTEKTIRRCGHVKAVKPLIKSGNFIEEMKNKCSHGNDIGVLIVDAIKENNIHRTLVISHSTPYLSAMARATALTCAIAAEYVNCYGERLKYGIIPLELMDYHFYDYMISKLKSVGVTINEKYIKKNELQNLYN